MIWRRILLEVRVLPVLAAVNCLQNAEEIADLEVRVRLAKVMCWLGLWRCFLPDSDRRSDQNRDESCFMLQPSTLSTQERLASAAIRSEICVFRRRMSGDPGEPARRASLRTIRLIVFRDRPGTKFGKKPRGILCMPAVWRALLKRSSPSAQEDSRGIERKRASDSSRKPDQLAFL